MADKEQKNVVQTNVKKAVDNDKFKNVDLSKMLSKLVQVKENKKTMIKGIKDRDTDISKLEDEIINRMKDSNENYLVSIDDSMYIIKVNESKKEVKKVKYIPISQINAFLNTKTTIVKKNDMIAFMKKFDGEEYISDKNLLKLFKSTDTITKDECTSKISLMINQMKNKNNKVATTNSKISYKMIDAKVID